jgi:hypothetical protein
VHLRLRVDVLCTSHLSIDVEHECGCHGTAHKTLNYHEYKLYLIDLDCRVDHILHHAQQIQKFSKEEGLGFLAVNSFQHALESDLVNSWCSGPIRPNLINPGFSPPTCTTTSMVL